MSNLSHIDPPFGRIWRKEEMPRLRRLSPTAVNGLIYLRGRAKLDGLTRTPPISRADFERDTGIPWRTWERARLALKEAGFLAESSVVRTSPELRISYRLSPLPPSHGQGMIPIRDVLPRLVSLRSTLATLTYAYVTSFYNGEGIDRSSAKIAQALSSPGHRVYRGQVCRAIKQLEDLGLLERRPSGPHRRDLLPVFRPMAPANALPLAQPPVHPPRPAASPSPAPRGHLPTRSGGTFLRASEAPSYAPVRHPDDGIHPEQRTGEEYRSQSTGLALDSRSPPGGRSEVSAQESRALVLSEVLAFPGWSLGRDRTRKLVELLPPAEVLARLERCRHGKNIRKPPALLRALLRKRQPFSEIQAEWDRDGRRELEAEAAQAPCASCTPDGYRKDESGVCDCARGRLRRLRHRDGRNRERLAEAEKESRARELEEAFGDLGLDGDRSQGPEEIEGTRRNAKLLEFRQHLADEKRAKMRAAKLTRS